MTNVEQRSASARRAAQALNAKLTPEQRSENARRAALAGAAKRRAAKAAAPALAPNSLPVTTLTIAWQTDVAAEDVRRLSRSLAQKVSEKLGDHAEVRVQTFGTVGDPVSLLVPAIQLIEEAGFVAVSRDVPSALAKAERSLVLAHKAMDGYDRAELDVVRERNELAERLRRQVGKAIRSEARLILYELDSTLEEGADGWAASLTVVCGILAGAREERVAEIAELPCEQVAKFAARLRSSGIWEHGKTIVDFDFEDADAGVVWVWLASLVADGSVIRTPAGYKINPPAEGDAGDECLCGCQDGAA
jgi:hypothetical protein